MILGASSGFGGATAVELAGRGFNIFGVHLDRKATLPNAEKIMDEIRGRDRKAVFFNINASDPEKREEALGEMRGHLEAGAQVRVLLHSLAFGTLKRFVPDDPKEALTKSQMDMTLEVMANSLVYWTQGLVFHGLMREGGRIYAMTSSGGHRVWHSYGPVSAAKAALESHCRQLALELAPRKITVNAIQAGVTDTPALRKIPGNEEMVQIARERNPMGRLTTPQDVAKAIAVLASEDNYWMTGNVIRVDGGEDIVG
ncbi:MAG: SDR family oxidoreductase [Calditrichaeota bacterium]|nr:MAG: SDR family oxidoreductase [Calditrichota bacterium]